ncbi:gamma-glutamylcyclotransferase family protein [Streptomyces virginiae]|uniref:gamma-glutamylcyclotransferase family protein n=1 Tax=Streptomyces virginiae TaxID=1961 RepID=UPI003433FD7F
MHPRIKTPAALLLSRRSFSSILFFFVAASLAVSALLALGLTEYSSHKISYLTAFRLTLSSVWNPGDLMFQEDESAGYYVFAGFSTLAGAVVPVLLLGSFVFKLFNRDPLQWRSKISLINRPGEGAVMVLRFYNGTQMSLVNMSIDVIARYETTAVPKSLINKPLDCLSGTKRVNRGFWAYSTPGVPFTVRVPLSETLSAAQTYEGGVIDLQGQMLEKSLVDIIALARGTVVETGRDFASMYRYSTEDCFSIGHPAEIEVDESTNPRHWNGWRQFEESFDVYLFAYGSLVSGSSMARTVGHEYHPFDGPIAARLYGWRRTWNVASDTSQLATRVYRMPDGSTYDGWVRSLGIKRDPSAFCNGAVFRVSAKDLSLLRIREHSYTEQDVSTEVTWTGKPADAKVVTYVPHDRLVPEPRNPGDVRPTVIRRGYIALIEDAFRVLGGESLDEYRDTTDEPDGIFVQDMDIEVVD